jgi:hypothetical protein
MENNDITSHLRTPLAIKTQKNFQTNKNEIIKYNDKTSRKLDENSKQIKPKLKNNIKTNLFSHDNFSNIDEDILEENEFSYNNFNSNFTKKEEKLSEQSEMTFDKIDLITEKIEALLPAIEQNDEIEINKFIEKTLFKEIVYVNFKDFERKEIVDNFVNEGLFFTDFE